MSGRIAHIGQMSHKIAQPFRNLEITTDNGEIEPSRLLISPQIY